MAKLQASDLECEILRLLINKGELYGMELVKASTLIKRGSVYVYLTRMEDNKWITSRAEADPRTPGLPRRRYKVTGEGAAVYRATVNSKAAIEAIFPNGVLA